LLRGETLDRDEKPVKNDGGTPTVPRSGAKRGKASGLEPQAT
jgi:hypothetical protein